MLLLRHNIGIAADTRMFFLRIRRFLKAYLMIVGSLTTGYVLIQLIVRILVELAAMN